MGRRHAVCEWKPRSGSEDTHRYQVKDLQKLLESQKLTLGDVVMHVYLGADPAKGGQGDFDGMMAGYTQFFGTRDQPNKPARTTVQIVLPAAGSGALIEIDLVAVRPE
jgi:enamine deaminase RidA (YjgF/YER057c/UK114 family)